MQHTTTEMIEAASDADDIAEIEATELELREDLTSLSLFSCCCPCHPE